MSVSTEQGRRVNGVHQDDAIRGIGLAIVQPDGRIWVQQDRGKRTQTGRDVDQHSIPFETQKVGEQLSANVLGALHEVFDDETLPPVVGRLYTTDGYLSTPTRLFRGGMMPIQYSLAVAVYDGPDDLFAPGPTEEAFPVGWMQPDAFLKLDSVRPLAHDAVGYLQEEGIIAEKLEEYKDLRHPTEPFVPEGFVLSEFHRRREDAHDMIPGRVYKVS